MKGIGEKLKEAREEMGVSIDEVSEDLKVKPSDIEEVEKGDDSAIDNLINSIDEEEEDDDNFDDDNF